MNILKVFIIAVVSSSVLAAQEPAMQTLKLKSDFCGCLVECEVPSSGTVEQILNIYTNIVHIPWYYIAIGIQGKGNKKLLLSLPDRYTSEDLGAEMDVVVFKKSE